MMDQRTCDCSDVVSDRTILRSLDGRAGIRAVDGEEDGGAWKRRGEEGKEA